MKDFEKFHKLMGIVGELYFEDPKYFIDCFFNLYYQMKKKQVIDKKCNFDEDLIKRTWASINFFKKMVQEKENEGKALIIACNYYKVNSNNITDILRSIKSYKSSKKTKFKEL